MMLQALLSYAKRRMLEDSGFADPDFEPVDLHWLIQINEDGKLSGDPLTLTVNNGNKKIVRRARRPATSVNEIAVRSLEKAKSYFLCDSLERVLLLTDEGTESTDPLVLARQCYFKKLLADAVNDAPFSATAILKFLNSPEEVTKCREFLRNARAVCAQNCTFQVAGKNVLDDPLLIQFWRNRRAMALATSKSSKQICLVTGLLSETVSTTEKIKGVGAQDTNLISANEAAFQSYTLAKAKNSPISPLSEQLTRAALNELIKKSLRTGDKSPIYHHHSTRDPVPEDIFALLESADEQGVARLLNAPRTGFAPSGTNPNAYYAMSLSGNGARIVVRDWLETTVPEIEAHVAAWFRDLAICTPDGSANQAAFKLGTLLYAMVREKIDELPPQLPTQLLYSALRGTLIPQQALAAALRRQHIERRKNSTDSDPKLNPARMALIKACLLRSPSNNPANAMTPTLNPQNSDPAYLCGRLFAVLDRLQYLALGQLNAGIAERFYASACSTPSLVMGRLFRNAQFHLAKAGGGMAENIRKDFEEISTAIGTTFPPSLDLEGQGRFALGYYHQKADYRRRTAERKEQQSQQSPE
jgi:CRISPR-associated protein Csd1